MLLVSTIIGMLFAAEATVRLMLPPVEYLDRKPYHPRYGVTQRGGDSLTARNETGTYEFRTNSLGFRGLDWGPRRDGVSRLVVVGDSFVMAWGAREEDTLPVRAATRLEEIASGAGRAERWEGLSLGSSAWGTASEWLAWRDHAARLAPDVVVLALFVGNDVASNGIELCERTRAGAIDRIQPYFVVDEHGGLRATSPRPFLDALRRWSKLVRLVEHRWLLGLEVSPLDRVWQEMWPRIEAGDLPIESMSLYAADPPARWENAWRVTERLILEIRAQAEAVGARFALCVLPELMQSEYGAHTILFEKYVEWRTGRKRDLLAELDWNAPQRRLRALAAREDFACLDLLPYVRREVRLGGRRFFSEDGHFMGLGYRRAGNLLGEFLAGTAEVIGLDDEPTPVPCPPPQRLELGPGMPPPPCRLGSGLEPWPDEHLEVRTGAEIVLRRPAAGSRLHVAGAVPDATGVPLLLQFRIDDRPAGMLRISERGPFAFSSPVRVVEDTSPWIVVHVRMVTIEKTPVPPSSRLHLLTIEFLP